MEDGVCVLTGKGEYDLLLEGTLRGIVVINLLPVVEVVGLSEI